MKHIVFCWEFGEGYGHISGFIPIAKHLQTMGIKVSWIIRHLDFAHLIKKNFDENTLIFQSPCTRNTNSNRSATLSYSHIISHLGYNNPQLLTNLLGTWRTLLQTLSVDLIVADHSPSAVLAAKTLNIKSCMIGTGFFSPPRQLILPQFDIFPPQSSNTLQKIDDGVLATINSSITKFNQAELASVSEIFTVEEDFLCTFPELDHYSNRDSDNYWGARYATNLGQSHQFKTDKYKVFVYLHSRTKNYQQLLEALNQLPIEGLIHIPKLDVSQLKKQYTNLDFSDQPIKLSAIENQVDLIICNAGHGTVAAALLSGIRLLVIPNQLEQRILAKKLTEQGLSAALVPESNLGTIHKALNFMIADSSIKANAANFKNRYLGFNSELHAEEIAKRCAEIVMEAD
ncbi:glycosyltransferase [Catenovulum agarivorans]|nr:nucleotide disphospho-sugar-binding domain-containing protein [Catenovulum agarivorans]